MHYNLSKDDDSSSMLNNTNFIGMHVNYYN